MNRQRDHLFVKPNASVCEIRDYIWEQFHKYERKERKEANHLIDVDWSGENAEERIQALAKKVEPIISHDLVKFAAARHFYLKMYKKAMSLNSDGKYQKEKAIHSLIYPLNADDQ